MTNFASEIRKRISMKMKNPDMMVFGGSETASSDINSLYRMKRKKTPAKKSVDRIVCDMESHQEEICGMLNVDFYTKGGVVEPNSALIS